MTGDIHFAVLFLNKKRSILTILDCGDLVAQNNFRKIAMKFIWYILFVRRVSKISTISESTKRDAMALINCLEAKIEVIPVAISTKFKRVDREFNQACPTIFQVGCASDKNIEGLAEALTGIPCKLCIRGQLSQSQLASINRAGQSHT